MNPVFGYGGGERRGEMGLQREKKKNGKQNKENATDSEMKQTGTKLGKEMVKQSSHIKHDTWQHKKKKINK